jgi:hypothetical protein
MVDGPWLKDGEIAFWFLPWTIDYGPSTKKAASDNRKVIAGSLFTCSLKLVACSFI